MPILQKMFCDITESLEDKGFDPNQLLIETE